MLKAKPELPYLTLGELGKSWGCSEEDILHRGIAGKVRICALSAGWELQEGYFSDDAPEGFPVPVKERWSNMEPIPLTQSSLRKILSSGEVIDPEFIFQADEAQNQGKDGGQFERFLSSVVISNGTRSKIVVKKGDLVVRKKDVEAFLSTYAEKNQKILKDTLPPENETEGLTASILRPEKQERRSELHDLIGKVIIELGFKGKKAPSLKVWNHIRKQQEKYECIRGVDDKEIAWISYRGFSQTMKRERFNSVVSEYNTGKRPYPDN